MAAYRSGETEILYGAIVAHAQLSRRRPPVGCTQDIPSNPVSASRAVVEDTEKSWSRHSETLMETSRNSEFVKL
jgi:hypothetical protein